MAPVLSAQSWLNLTFLHWAIDPEPVRGLFPPGTRPDVIDGRTYIALVPLRMSRVSAGASWSPPWLGNFAESNVRLYSVDERGRHGVLFRSLETERLAFVFGARAALGVPYTWARMRVDRTGDLVRYASRRRWPRPGLRCELTIAVGERTEPTDLEAWLTQRWGAHSRHLGRTVWTPVAHPAWPLHEAMITALADDLVPAGLGFGVPPEPTLRPLWSPGVRATFGRPTVL
jgi:uncharacterized protein YqjF (DUF2071 family)